VTGHHHLLDTNPTLRRLIEMRNPYIDPINILQVRQQHISTAPAQQQQQQQHSTSRALS